MIKQKVGLITKISGRASRLMLSIVSGATLSASALLPTAAAAQTCEISKNANGDWLVATWPTGTVTSFGDLRIRFQSSSGDTWETVAWSYDIKYPGGEILGENIVVNSSKTYRICGKIVGLILFHRNINGVSDTAMSVSVGSAEW
jgi:hypothetical protein